MSSQNLKLVCDFSEPRLASDDSGHGYLPHAAMGLGSMRAVGTHHGPAPVSRLVVQKQTGGWCLFRLDADGGFVGDTWHPDADDAIKTATAEFGVTKDDFTLKL